MPKKQFYDYEGKDILVRYEPKRCIHAEACIKGAPAVFDRDRRPWIEPDQGQVDHLAEVVSRCPTGALHFARRDGGEAESISSVNRARAAVDGPLYVEGSLRLRLPDGSARDENRVAFCRCGASENKPFCDNSHLQAGFVDRGELGAAMMAPGSGEGAELELSTAANGPLLFRGPLEIHDASDRDTQTGSKGALCRCGASQNRPYCDGSHVAAGFEAE